MSNPISPTDLALIAAKVFEYMKKNDIEGEMTILKGKFDTLLPIRSSPSTYSSEPEQLALGGFCAYTDSRGRTVYYPCSKSS